MITRRAIHSFWPDGDGSTLSLDFTTGVLDPRLTFTRSTTGTYINSSGYVTSAAINAPRFDYDPTTLAPRGLLIEGAANNLLNWSESFATSGGTNNNWADNNLTRNSTNNTDPANGTTALRVTAASANGTIISTAAIGTSAQRTFSIWLRRVSGTGDIQYTLDNGSTYTTQAITSSWVRYTFASTTAAQRVGIRIVTSGDSIELWGAQLEAGSGASSYIPTGASQGSRAADSLVIQDGTWRNTANIDSTWYADGALNKMSTAFNPLFLVVGNAGYTEQNRVFISATGSQVRFTHYARSASVNPDFEYAINQASPNGYVYGSRFKVAATFDNTAGENRSSWNGATSNGTTAAACTTTTTYFTIAVGSGNDWHFRSIKYWPLSLPQTTLNGITTL